jgi:ATP-dependent exoDNAse (exonuclease V) alpha subunit
VRLNLHDHPHLDHGYVVTSHSAQGQTADRVLVHVDTERVAGLVNRRLAYVAISRARYDAQIYTNNRTQLAGALERDLPKASASNAIESERSKPQLSLRPTE